MQQQSRRTERHSRQEQQQSRQTRRNSPSSSLLPVEAALQALLAGAGLEQMPARTVLELSERIGNSALLALVQAQKTGPQLESARLPPPALTEPLACVPDQPQLQAAPDWGQMPFAAGGTLEL